MIGLILILFCIFLAFGLASFAIIPFAVERASIVNEKRHQSMTNRMENIMSRTEAKKMSRMFIFAPLALAGALYIAFPEGMQVIGLVLGFIGGFIFPGIYIKLLTKKRLDKFNDQLVDALMIMSSSFRGGLSLIQALEAVIEEMPEPIQKEFGIVVGENKMGVALEEALYHLYGRMPSSALQQMITAILLARETGGNLPAIFNRIVTNIRETKKIQQNLDTLTIQGKIQGVVMILLPIGFGFIVYSANRRIFEHMLISPLGRMMLIYAVVSEVIGAFLIWKISTFKEY